MSATPILELDDLQINFSTRAGDAPAVDGVSLSIRREKPWGWWRVRFRQERDRRAIMRLVPRRPADYAGGRIRSKGKDLLTISEGEMQSMRGGQIAMVFQDPMTFLNPVYTAGEQVAEAIRTHQGAASRSRAQTSNCFARRNSKCRSALSMPIRIEFSGGHAPARHDRDGAFVAARALIADEPTTALDVTIQAQILDLLRNCSRRSA